MNIILLIFILSNYAIVGFPMEKQVNLNEHLNDLSKHEILKNLDLEQQANLKAVSKGFEKDLSNLNPILSTELNKNLQIACGPELTARLLRATVGKDHKAITVTIRNEKCWPVFEELVCKNRYIQKLHAIKIKVLLGVPKLSCLIDVDIVGSFPALLRSFKEALEYKTPFEKIKMSYDFDRADLYSGIFTLLQEQKYELQKTLNLIDGKMVFKKATTNK